MAAKFNQIFFVRPPSIAITIKRKCRSATNGLQIGVLDRIFDNHGEWVVFFARFIPNIRTLISVPAGLFGMSHKRFILATSAGATVWNSALVYAGYQLQQNVDHIEDYLGPVSLGVIGLIVVAYIWRIIFWRPKED